MRSREDEIREVGAAMRDLVLHPTLQEVVEAQGLDTQKLSVGLKMHKGRPDVSAREEVIITAGNKIAVWRVPSLRDLFRGEKLPPSMSNQPPPAYMPMFFFIEKHLLSYCDGVGDQTDAEFEDAFSNLRRRPDGKSLTALHYFLWQVAAGLLGVRPISAAEFEAIFGRLALSASHFKNGPVSRNYVSTLRMTMP